MLTAMEIQTPAYQITVSVDQMWDAREEQTALEKRTPAKVETVNVVRMTNAVKTKFAYLENAMVWNC